MIKAIQVITIGLVTSLLIIAVAEAQTPKAVPTQANTLASRWLIIQHPTMRADQYLLDTQTGHVWQMVADANGIQYWQEMRKAPLK